MSLLNLPDSFEFGAATSAFQIEGAWDADGKGPSIWDTFGHTPGKVLDDIPGDVACDHYHRYPEDIEIMKWLGLDSYRFSLSWSRIMPEGVGRINQKGLDFYRRLTDSLLDAGITPNATLYHWDLPQALEDRGGWPDRDVADWFAEYASVVFDALGDRIGRWATVNEPISTWVGYALGAFAPGRRDERAGRQAMHNQMLAHGKAVQAFRAAGSPGDIGVVLDIWKRQPATDSLEDLALAAQGEDDGFRFFLDTLRGGGYSDRLRERLEADGTFPEVHDGDQEIIASPVDYLGLNVYSRVVVNSKNQDATGWAESDPPPPAATSSTTGRSSTRAPSTRHCRWSATTTAGTGRSTSPRTDSQTGPPIPAPIRSMIRNGSVTSAVSWNGSTAPSQRDPMCAGTTCGA